MEKLKTKALLSLEYTIAEPLLKSRDYPWEILPEIKEFIIRIGKRLDPKIYREIREGVYVARSAEIAESAYIGAPAIIGEGSEIRHNAFIRGAVIIGRECIVGNSTEMKNSIIFDGVQVPHYNYVGDSVLGYRSHLGAGAVTSNVKSDKSKVTVAYEGRKIDTGLRKFGAILADTVEVGCNSVLCPGSVIGRCSTVYPLSRVRGFIPEGMIYKSEGKVQVKKESIG